MSKWIEYDPDTGVTETNVADDDGNVIVHKSQDVSGLLDHTAEARNTRATDQGIKNGLWHYCSIPLAVQYEMLTKHGVNIHKREHWPRMFDLVNKHYPYLKTTDKVHAYRNTGQIFVPPRTLPSKAISTAPGS